MTYSNPNERKQTKIELLLLTFTSYRYLLPIAIPVPIPLPLSHVENSYLGARFRGSLVKIWAGSDPSKAIVERATVDNRAGQAHTLPRQAFGSAVGASHSMLKTQKVLPNGGGQCGSTARAF
jgi:hypothetical protein